MYSCTLQNYDFEAVKVDTARLEENEVKLVMSAIDYDKKDEMYDQAQKALRKFLGKKQRRRIDDDEIEPGDHICTEFFAEEAKWEEHVEEEHCYRFPNYWW